MKQTLRFMLSALVWAAVLLAAYAVSARAQTRTQQGIGTYTPASKLTVAGTIEARGLMFSDGTLQTTAAVGGLSLVMHDSTLTGSGTQQFPLGIASQLTVRDPDNPARQPFVATLLYLT